MNNYNIIKFLKKSLTSEYYEMILEIMNLDNNFKNEVYSSILLFLVEVDGTLTLDSNKYITELEKALKTLKEKNGI